MSLEFTFLCTTNQANALTINGAFDFHKKLTRKNGIEFDKLDKGKKNKNLLRVNLKRIKTKLLIMR